MAMVIYQISSLIHSMQQVQFSWVFSVNLADFSFFKWLEVPCTNISNFLREFRAPGPSQLTNGLR